MQGLYPVLVYCDGNWLMRVHLDFHENKYLTFMSMSRVEISVLYKLSDRTQILWFNFTTWP